MAWIAPIAAAAHHRQEEAELLDKLKKLDPEGRYEFKIIRGSIKTFRNDDYLQEVLDIERQGGWEFVEKIDNTRVVLRRLRNLNLKEMNPEPDYDPYRVQYDNMNANALAILLGLVVLVGFMLVFGKGLANQDAVVNDSESSSPVIIIAITVFILLMVVLVKIRRK